VEVLEFTPIVGVPSLGHAQSRTECLQQELSDGGSFLRLESFRPEVLGEVIQDGQDP
jgi:hypothetical protein